jgi:hypothetical protein
MTNFSKNWTPEMQKEYMREYHKKHYAEHREENIEKSKEYYRTHKKEIRNRQRIYERKRFKTDSEFRKKQREKARKYFKKLMIEVLTHYSNGKPKCVCCGTEYLVFLTIDHINNDGAEHRKKTGEGSHFYRWLKRNNYPEGYQVLCFNCNWAKSHGGCPHIKESEMKYD